MGAGNWQSVPVALAAVVLSFALALWILNAEGSPPPPTTSASSREGPERIAVPLAGSSSALMLGSHSRDVLFGLAAAPGGPVDFVALTPDGPARRDSVEAFVESSRQPLPADLRSCGVGCFRLATPALAGEPLRLSVRVARPSGLARARFRLPSRLPPSGRALFGSVNRVMDGLRTLRIRQTLSSGKVLVRATYSLQAPDRLRFETSTGQKTILIRNRRWDLEEGRWVSDEYPGTEVPTYVWEGATHARIVGRGLVRGRPVTFLALFKSDPTIPIWFRLAVARDGRVLRADMVAQAHFMTDRYSDFNKPISIQPPA